MAKKWFMNTPNILGLLLFGMINLGLVLLPFGIVGTYIDFNRTNLFFLWYPLVGLALFYMGGVLHYDFYVRHVGLKTAINDIVRPNKTGVNVNG